MSDPKHIVRTGTFDWSTAFHGRHPFNPESEMRMVPVGRLTGLARVGVQLIRVPPGKQSFIPHAHSVNEEFVYVISGAGEAVLDGVAHAIGPGDFVGFPIDGVVHCLVSTGPEDLVYLTAGVNTRVEVADMPSIGKTAVFRDDRVDMYGADGVERLTMAEWFARMAVPEDQPPGGGG